MPIVAAQKATLAAMKLFEPPDVESGVMATRTK
jgi:hypothetical protein